jgi:multiple sugar transport system permease protein
MVNSFLRHFFLCLLALFTLFPFFWMIITSIKGPADIFVDHIVLIPEHTQILRNYGVAFSKAPLLRYLMNGLIVTSVILFFQLLISLPCAYALAKLKFKGKQTLMGFVLAGLLIPPHAVAIPVFLLLHEVGLLNSYAALILPWTISVFGIFLFRQFIKTIPDDLIDAARMDGMSELGIVWSVVIPLSGAAVSAFAIFSIIAHWNDYFWPLIAVNNQSLFTPPLGVAHFRNEDAGSDFGALMASATIVVAPLILIFILLQKRFVQGVVMTGMK